MIQSNYRTVIKVWLCQVELKGELCLTLTINCKAIEKISLTPVEEEMP